MVNLKSVCSNIIYDPNIGQFKYRGEKVKSSMHHIASFYEPIDFEYDVQRSAKRNEVSVGEARAKKMLKLHTGVYEDIDVLNFAEWYAADKYKMKSTALPLEAYHTSYESIKKMWNELPDHIVPKALNIAVYSKKYKFASVVHGLLWNKKENTYTLIDYNMDPEIMKGYGHYMYPPFSAYAVSDYNLHGLKLNYDQIIFQEYGINVTNRIIIHIKEKNYELYSFEDNTKILIQDLNA